MSLFWAWASSVTEEIGVNQKFAVTGIKWCNRKRRGLGG